MAQFRPRILALCGTTVTAILLLTGCGGEPSGEVVGTAGPSAVASAKARPSASSAEYEKATPEHPARNVPTPVLPEAAKEDTDAGARAFLQYWADSLNYLLQTGDAQYVQAVMTEDNQQFAGVVTSYEGYYREGKWSVGTEQQVHPEAQELDKLSDQSRILNVRLNRTPGKVYSPTGSSEEIKGEDFNQQPIEARMLFEDGRWRLQGFRGIEDVDYGL